MTDHNPNDTPTGLSPSVDPPEQKRRKVLAGRGVVIFIIAVAVVAFTLYFLIGVSTFMASS